MTPLWGHVSGVITVILLLVFVGIWIWAWRPRHKKPFEKMSQIPMQDKDAPHDDGGNEDTEK